jgi:hypothetical protein
MSNTRGKRLYICPRCFQPCQEDAICKKCGKTAIIFYPGEADDPCRRPLISPSGKIRSHAPLWWLRQVRSDLINNIENDTEKENRDR